MPCSFLLGKFSAPALNARKCGRESGIFQSHFLRIRRRLRVNSLSFMVAPVCLAWEFTVRVRKHGAIRGLIFMVAPV